MDSTVHKKRQQNPVEHANFFSRITYLYVLPLFCKGEIRETDIYEPLEGWTCTNLGNKLEVEWEKEKSNEDPWLVRPILRVFGWRMVLLGFFVVVVGSAAMISKPLLVGNIVRFFEPNQTELTLKQGLAHCGILVVSLIISTLLDQYLSYQTDLLILRVKIACSTLVYRKLIKTKQNLSSRGQAVTLISKDLNSSELLLFSIYQLVTGVLMISALGYIMYMQIGISAIMALSWLLVYIPVQALLGKGAAWFRIRASAVTDTRVRGMQEVCTAARIIKMYAWESFFIKSIETIRKKEMSGIRAFYTIEATAYNLGHMSVKVILYIAILAYIGFGENLTAEKVFVIMTCIRALSALIHIYTPMAIIQFSNFISAIRRFHEFLAIEEVTQVIDNKQVMQSSHTITTKNLTVLLGNTNILSNVNVQVENGLTLLKGPIGSGKSTLLLAIIGEVQTTKGDIEVLGTISYASQEPWLFPGTVRQNILFGENFDNKRYETVIQVCRLKKDLESFSNGDSTYLTDRGQNLSRGQKTRINLARCVYRKSDIYLLDDCLSALDCRVAKQIFYECIKGFLKNKICIMAAHNQDYMQEAAQVLLLSNGNVSSLTTQNVKVANGDSHSQELTPVANSDTESEIHESESNPNEESNSNENSFLLTSVNTPKNVYEEYNEAGSVTKKVYYFYFSSGGGISVFISILVLLVLSQAVGSWSDYFVSIWVNVEQNLSAIKSENKTNSTQYLDLAEARANKLMQYSAIVAATIALGFFSYIAFVIFSYSASVNIHRNVLYKIFNAGIVFFDKNLSGNILNRFSRDFAIMDDWLPGNIIHFLQLALFIIATLCVVSSVQPFLIIPSALLLTILYIARRFYLRCSRSIRRLEGSTRSPVIGYLNATVDGLATIRSSIMESVVVLEFERHLDLYNTVTFMNLTIVRAFAFQLDMLCNLYIGVVTFALMLLRNGLISGEVGLAITQSLTLSGVLVQFGVRQWAEIENRMTSTERIMAYTKVVSENIEGQQPEDWPKNGRIVFNDVSLTYPSTGDLVLRHVNFAIDSKDKLGVVGRTGAGKSSLISVLYQLYDFDGSITIDGINTNQVNRHYLRTRISIIPQDPFLFTGTLRTNLDPNNEYSDKQLWQALEQVEMKIHVDNLDIQISEGGDNFSIGQKQLVCLARAILRKNIILVLDEATANLDLNTDAIIQKTINKHFADCTVITIAHRINTILNSDKILVMNLGQVVEYGTPRLLLSNKNGNFYRMVKDSGLPTEY